MTSRAAAIPTANLSGALRAAAGVALLLLAALLPTPAARAQLLLDRHPAEALGTEIVEKRGDQVPLDLVFTDSGGRDVPLSDFFDGERPVVLILGYYDCPLLCTLIFNGVQKGFNDLAFTLGRDFRAIAVSIDHTNPTSMAAMKQAAMLAGYSRVVPDESWEFFTGDATSIRALAESVGFGYAYMPKADEFSHASVIMVLTPDGVVSNYLYGIDYPGKQLRLALMDAAEGRMGSLFDRILFYCHIYDPDAGSYVLQAFRVMQIGALLTVVAISGGIGWLFWSGSRRAGPPAEADAGASPAVAGDAESRMSADEPREAGAVR